MQDPNKQPENSGASESEQESFTQDTQSSYSQGPQTQGPESQGPEMGDSYRQADSQQTTDHGPQSQVLIDELNRLGAKFAEAIDAAWKSEERKRLEDDLRTGVVSVAQSLETHLKEFSRREETQKVLDKAEHVAEQVRSSKVSQEIAGALAQGLRSLSEQLEKLAQDLREREKNQNPVDPASQATAGTGTPPPESPTVPPTPGATQADGEDIPIQRQ